MNQISTTNTGLSELNSKGIVTINTILVPKSIDDEIHNNELLANVFAKVIENNNYFSEIPVKKDKKGKVKEIKKWINISGWSFIDRVLKITPHIVKSELKFVKREKAKERLEYCCTCELRTIEGLVFSTALGKANSGEEYKEKFTESKLESLAQSRAISKAHRLYFQDILEKLNLNNDLIIEADFVNKKDPENATELIDKHSEMMKKHSLLSDEEIDKNTEKLKNELEKSKEEAKKKENRKGPIITGSFTKKEEECSEEKTIARKAIEDSEKRAKENKDFKKANEVEKNNDLVDDPGARQFIKDIIIDIGSNNESLIKKEIADRVKDNDSGVTMKEATRAIKELERNGVPK